jgi:hypothetical protein
MPDWLAELRDRLPVERRATMAYLNLKALVEQLSSLPGGGQIQAGLDALGLGNVTSLAAVTGLDGEGFVSKTLLATDGEPQGLLDLLGGKPLGPAELAAVPADATLALAARLDLDRAFQTVLGIVEKFNPQARDETNQGLAKIQRELGFDLRQDMLQSLGDVWCVYNSPGEGGLVITGLTGVVTVTDHRRLADAHAKLLAVIRAELDRQGSRRRVPRIEQFQFAGQDVYFLNTLDREFPLAPAWCITEKELIVAPLPQNIKAYLSRGQGFKSLATVPEVTDMLASSEGTNLLLYADTPELFKLAYPFLMMVARVATAEMQREGVNIDVSILPSAPAIGRHLRPDVMVMRRSKAGIELVSRQSLPGGNIGTAAPVGVALLLPAVQSAREAARRAQSMNNLKQIALAMLNHESAHGSFPPAYSTGKNGEPLLSWRVAILPYMEEQALYEQFHLDEPWDSEHNIKLLEQMPAVYKAPGSNAGPGKTVYLTLRGEHTAFPGKQKVSLRDIRDGTSNTIMAVEASDAKAVPWTKPDDFEYDPEDPIAGLVGVRPGGFIAVFCDGSVHFISRSIDKTALKALFTRDGGEMVNVGAF